MKISLFTRKDRLEVIAGDETFRPAPLDLERAIRLALLLAPYVALIEEHLPEFRQALASEERPRLLSALLTVLARRIEPKDFTLAFETLLDRPPEWFRNVRAIDLVQALPVLDEINDFGGLLRAIKELGLNVRYRNGD